MCIVSLDLYGVVGCALFISTHCNLCASFSWLKGLEVNGRHCKVDCSNVVMSNGKGYILGKTRCGLCGLRGGMKAKCYDPTCRARGERRIPYHFHVTCSRQAGLEVNHNDRHPSDGQFYGTCVESEMFSVNLAC
jgi:hypothetical protein